MVAAAPGPVCGVQDRNIGPRLQIFASYSGHVPLEIRASIRLGPQP